MAKGDFSLRDLNLIIQLGQKRYSKVSGVQKLNFSAKLLNDFCAEYNSIFPNENISVSGEAFKVVATQSSNNATKSPYFQSTTQVEAVLSSRWLLYVYAYLPFYRMLMRYESVFKDEILDIVFGAQRVSTPSQNKIKDVFPVIDIGRWQTEVDTIHTGISGHILTQISSKFNNSPFQQKFLLTFMDDKYWWGLDSKGKRVGRKDFKNNSRNAMGVISENTGKLPNFLKVFDGNRNLYSRLNKEVKRTIRIQPTVITRGENKIFYGAPGTGKSDRIDKILKLKNSYNFIRTVFHSETQQSDFIGCLKPCAGSKGVTYEFQPGPFSEIYTRALNKPGEEFNLVIEEINRAPAAAAFGEVFQLLDRDSNGRGVYEISAIDPMHEEWLQQEMPGWNNKIRMPGNLTLYATMNSSDQGVFPLDTAFKRRWTYEYIPIDFSNCPKGNIYFYHDRTPKTKTWKEFAEKINECLAEEGIPEDRHLGPWFVQGSELSQQKNLSPVLTGKVFLYLWDDVLRHGDRTIIFLDKIKTYGELVSRYKKQKNVFSDDLIGKLK